MNGAFYVPIQKRTFGESSRLSPAFLQTFGVDTSKLAAETRRVWEFLSAQPALGGFILIGGTALTMQIGHRVSEDLDFITIAPKLPRAALNALVQILERSGFTVVRDDDPIVYDEFLIAGMSLHDHQQNFLIDGVKVNIFTPNPDLAGMVEPSSAPLVQVASVAELFRTKALAAANRIASRDWVDLFVLFNQHGFTLADLRRSFQHPGIHDPEQRLATAFQNLCRGVTTVTDPGYDTLLPNSPSLGELVKYFIAMRNEYEIQRARDGFGTP